MTIYIKTFFKAPGTEKDYQIDWTGWLGNDVILSSKWEPSAGLVVEAASIINNTKSVVWLSGGFLYHVCECLNTITTVGGRTESALLKIKIA